MDDILRGASTQSLEELVEVLLRAASAGQGWEDERAIHARDAMRRLELCSIFPDWQQAYDTVGMQALKVLRVRYKYGIDRPV